MGLPIPIDSLNRNRKKPKLYPGQAKPKPSPGPGTPAPLVTTSPTGAPPRLSIPPSQTANKAPLAPSLAGTVEGQPPRKRLKVDDDPFGAVGDYAGSFLIKSAVELSTGYDTNPGRLPTPVGSPFYVIAPEFLAVSDWDRHALVADLRGSFTGYGDTLPQTVDGGISPAPLNVDRPDFTGHIDGRLDVTNDTRLTAEVRLRLPPTIPAARISRPASPNIQSIRRSAAPSASTRISTACRSPPAALSTVPSIRTPYSPMARRPAMTTATSTSTAESAGSATICCRG